MVGFGLRKFLTPGRYRLELALLRSSELFDADYYLQENPDVAAIGKDPVIDYLEFGQDGRNPSLGFDAQYYLSTYEDVRKTKANPLVHYLRYGRREGRSIKKVQSKREKENARLLLQSRLFDEKFYLRNYPDVASSGKSPAVHYLEFGHEGRNPSADFDAQFYIASYPDVRYAKENPLIHYLRFGEREGREIRSVTVESEKEQVELLRESSLFDPEYYFKRYPDAAESGIDPYLHYVRYGSQGRHPSANFDAKFYLRKNSDVRTKKANPLIHYLRHGRQEDRQTRPVSSGIPTVAEHSTADWNRLASDYAARRSREPATVDIVIPVYRGFEETSNCLFTVIESRIDAETSCDIVVIDDRTPDEQLRALLDELAAKGVITLIRNAENLGFVESVNAGMRQHDDRDVILLNSDTEVYNDWVERLRNAVYSNSNIGTATPFSNNATICSYPDFPNDFDGAFEVPFAEIDKLTGEANAGKIVDLPTAVGLCMYIRRECLREVGLFDAEAFGRGYGEENDFCMKIAAREWRNILAGDVFVRHLGGVSFSETATLLQQNAIAVIRRRYPGYERLIEQFLIKDPIKPLRRNLDLARLQRFKGKGFFLFVLHNRGGGTQRNVNDLSSLLTAEGYGTLVLTNASADGATAVIGSPQTAPLSNGMQFDIRHGLSTTANLMRALGVVHIHVHHLIDFVPEMGGFVQRLCEACGLRYDVTTHDYFVACPRVHMIGTSGHYCENSDVSVCEQCIATLGTPVGDVAAWLWRENHGKLLANARQVFVPDQDVADRLSRFYPNVSFTVKKHPEIPPEQCEQPVPRQLHEPLRVAIIGAINREKGAEVIAECLADIERRQLPIKIVVMGTINNAEIRNSPHVQVLGRYVDDELQGILKRSQCHVAFFPSICPETYSYTLSHAQYAGLYPVAFDLGATANRIRAGGWGTILPRELITMPAKINDTLLGLRPPGERPSISTADSVSYNNASVDYYDFDPAKPIGPDRTHAPVVQPIRPAAAAGSRVE
jgi:GT2 family glycosyltransferase